MDRRNCLLFFSRHILASSKIDSQEEKPVPDASQLQMPYSDEYGIPILDLSSDTDDVSHIHSFPSKIILDVVKLKAFADYKIDFILLF